MNIQPENMTELETKIINFVLLEYLYTYIFVKSTWLTFEQKVSRYEAIQIKINSAFS